MSQALEFIIRLEEALSEFSAKDYKGIADEILKTINSLTDEATTKADELRAQADKLEENPVPPAKQKELEKDWVENKKELEAQIIKSVSEILPSYGFKIKPEVTWEYADLDDPMEGKDHECTFVFSGQMKVPVLDTEGFATPTMTLTVLYSSKATVGFEMEDWGDDSVEWNWDTPQKLPSVIKELYDKFFTDKWFKPEVDQEVNRLSGPLREFKFKLTKVAFGESMEIVALFFEGQLETPGLFYNNKPTPPVTKLDLTVSINKPLKTADVAYLASIYPADSTDTWDYKNLNDMEKDLVTDIKDYTVFDCPDCRNKSEQEKKECKLCHGDEQVNVVLLEKVKGKDPKKWAE